MAFYQTQIPFVKGLKEELDKIPEQLNKVEDLGSSATTSEIVTAFNALIADMKAKGLMKTE